MLRLFFAFLVIAFHHLFSVNDPLHRNDFRWDFMKSLTVKPSLDLIIENYYEFGVGHQNAVGPFTAPDMEAYSLMGEDFRWLQFYDQGFNISDRFFSGASLHKLELNEQDVWIHPIFAQIHVKSLTNQRQLAGFDLGTGFFGNDDLQQGSRIYNFFLNDLLKKGGAGQPIDRYPDTPTSRKRNRYHLETTYNSFFEKEKGFLYIKNLNQFGTRKFNTFDFWTVNGSYDEDYVLSQSLLDWVPKVEPVSSLGFTGISARFTHLTRSHLYAERYYSKEETAHLDSDALSLWGNLKYQNLVWTPGISFSRKKIQHNTPNFYRNLVDQDGMGFQPWYPDADIFELTFNNHLEWEVTLPWLDASFLKADWDNTLMIHSSKDKSHHPIYFQHRSTADTSIETNVSLYVARFENAPFSYYLGHLFSEFSVEKKLFEKYLHFQLTAGAVLDTLFLKDRSLALPEIEYHAHMTFVKTPRVFFSVRLGQKAIPLGSELALFMSKDYMNGAYRYWNDSNANGIFESGEEGSLHRTMGGRFYEYADKLRHPDYFYFDMPFDLHLGKYVVFNAILGYKLFKDLFKVRFKDNYGSTRSVTSVGEGDLETVGTSQDVFVYRGGETRYVLENEKRGIVPGKSIFTKRPFYGGALFKLITQTKHVFFSISFKLYMVVAPNKYGNGFYENNLGTFTVEDANPNTDIHSIGRMHQDKGYIGKLHIAVTPLKDLWTSLSLKYRDGTPTAHYEYYIHSEGTDHQAVLWNEGINGNNPFTGINGQREDSLWNIDWDISYSWQIRKLTGKVYFQVYNLLDLGNELVEMVFREGRRALEIEQPRGFRTGLQLIF